ncbi:MFS transporter [Altericroceibacterium endophyticum]|uniref:MFS transporter n=1 Tax=Altericroceibacterium endophyticum TaxID=1808508 RepID=A0A6I4T473_9SPHN|nr:MFS transporter [Altericroceibacterium endophyticum]MXO65032.1 MFS transporter [Altericroceibacterium endophyticum]
MTDFDNARMPSGRFDVAAFLDGLPLTAFHKRLIILSCLVTFFEGLDFLLISYTIPYIRDEMGLADAVIGLVISAGVAGQMVGSLGGSFLADRIGRRPVIAACSFFAAILTFLTGFATSAEMLMVIRFGAGLMIGGLLPVAWALNIEAMPPGRRATAVAVVMFGFSLGASLAGPATNLLAPDYGWEMVYFVAGTATFAVSILLLVFLPESARFLVTRGAGADRIERALRRFVPAFDGAKVQSYVLGDERSDTKNRNIAAVMQELFRGPLAKITPLIWAAYFASSVAIFLKSSLGPVYLEELGMERQVAAWIGSIGGISGAIAGVLLLRFTESKGPKWIALFPALAVPCLLAVGMGLTSGPLFIPIILAGSVLVGGGHAAVISIAGLYYPSAIRSSAGGWASFVAKIGATIAPMIGAMFLASSADVLRAYTLSAVCMVGIVLCVITLAHYARRMPQGRAQISSGEEAAGRSEKGEKALA